MNGHRLAAATAALMLLLSAPVPGAETEWKKVDEALGRQGAMQPGDVYKFSFPRSDPQASPHFTRLQRYC
jgi:hypothetical protein